MGEYKEAKTTIANMCPVCVRCGHVFESLKMIRKPEETKIVDNETILHKLWSAHQRAAISRARSRNRLAGIGTQRTLCGIQGVEI